MTSEKAREPDFEAPVVREWVTYTWGGWGPHLAVKNMNDPTLIEDRLEEPEARDEHNALVRAFLAMSRRAEAAEDQLRVERGVSEMRRQGEEQKARDLAEARQREGKLRGALRERCIDYESKDKYWCDVCCGSWLIDLPEVHSPTCLAALGLRAEAEGKKHD